MVTSQVCDVRRLEARSCGKSVEPRDGGTETAPPAKVERSALGRSQAKAVESLNLILEQQLITRHNTAGANVRWAKSTRPKSRGRSISRRASPTLRVPIRLPLAATT